MTSRQSVAVDACVLLNLLASERPLSEFAAALGVEFMLVQQAEREVEWLDADEPGDPRTQLDLDPLFARNELQRIALTAAELPRFVTLARSLGDGEAATLAIAEARNFAVATDDRKARRVLAKLNTQPQLLSTTAFVRTWAAGHSDAETRACIRLIERRASFIPPSTDPDCAWWEARRR